jgi:hypothetical protein
LKFKFNFFKWMTKWFQAASDLNHSTNVLSMVKNISNFNFSIEKLAVHKCMVPLAIWEISGIWEYQKMLGVFEKHPNKKRHNLRNNIEGRQLVNCQFSTPTATEGFSNHSTTTCIEHSNSYDQGWNEYLIQRRVKHQNSRQTILCERVFR